MSRVVILPDGRQIVAGGAIETYVSEEDKVKTQEFHASEKSSIALHNIKEAAATVKADAKLAKPIVVETEEADTSESTESTEGSSSDDTDGESEEEAGSSLGVDVDVGLLDTNRATEVIEAKEIELPLVVENKVIQLSANDIDVISETTELNGLVQITDGQTVVKEKGKPGRRKKVEPTPLPVAPVPQEITQPTKESISIPALDVELFISTDNESSEANANANASADKAIATSVGGDNKAIDLEKGNTDIDLGFQIK